MRLVHEKHTDTYMVTVDNEFDKHILSTMRSGSEIELKDRWVPSPGFDKLERTFLEVSAEMEKKKKKSQGQ